MAFWHRFLAAPASFETGVLMICMGNICRSPLAQGALQHKLEAAGLARRVRVDSAGTHCERGAPADLRAVRVAAQRGYDLSRVRSRRIETIDFERYELILAMDQDNFANLQELCPEPLRHRVAMLLDLAPRDDAVRDVPDPYYGAVNGFEHVLDLIEPACDALVLQLQSSLTGAAEPKARGAEVVNDAADQVPNRVSNLD